MKTVKSILLIALAVMMASCCACRKGKKVVDKPLTATKWELVELNGQQIKTNDNYYIMLSDTSNNFNGRGDCNSLMGNYTLDSETSKLKLNAIGSTRAFCPDQAGEDKFFQTLGQVNNYDLDGDLLLLFNNNSELILVMQAK
jgi:heat shock protein HslJ